MTMAMVTDDHRERARRMFGCGFDAEDLAQLLASHEAEREQLRAIAAAEAKEAENP